MTPDIHIHRPCSGSPADMDEYLRRNLLVAKSIGITANVGVALKRLEEQSMPPKWLIGLLKGIVDRNLLIPRELAAHRDEIDVR